MVASVRNASLTPSGREKTAHKSSAAVGASYCGGLPSLTTLGLVILGTLAFLPGAEALDPFSSVTRTLPHTLTDTPSGSFTGTEGDVTPSSTGTDFGSGSVTEGNGTPSNSGTSSISGSITEGSVTPSSTGTDFDSGSVTEGKGTPSNSGTSSISGSVTEGNVTPSSTGTDFDSQSVTQRKTISKIVSFTASNKSTISASVTTSEGTISFSNSMTLTINGKTTTFTRSAKGSNTYNSTDGRTITISRTLSSDTALSVMTMTLIEKNGSKTKFSGTISQTYSNTKESTQTPSPKSKQATPTRPPLKTPSKDIRRTDSGKIIYSRLPLTRSNTLRDVPRQFTRTAPPPMTANALRTATLTQVNPQPGVSPIPGPPGAPGMNGTGIPGAPGKDGKDAVSTAVAYTAGSAVVSGGVFAAFSTGLVRSMLNKGAAMAAARSVKASTEKQEKLKAAVEKFSEKLSNVSLGNDELKEALRNLKNTGDTAKVNINDGGELMGLATKVLTHLRKFDNQDEKRIFTNPAKVLIMLNIDDEERLCIVTIGSRGDTSSATLAIQICQSKDKDATNPPTVIRSVNESDDVGVPLLRNRDEHLDDYDAEEGQEMETGVNFLTEGQSAFESRPETEQMRKINTQFLDRVANGSKYKFYKGFFEFNGTGGLLLKSHYDEVKKMFDDSSLDKRYSVDVSSSAGRPIKVDKGSSMDRPVKVNVGTHTDTSIDESLVQLLGELRNDPRLEANESGDVASTSGAASGTGTTVEPIPHVRGNPLSATNSPGTQSPQPNTVRVDTSALPPVRRERADASALSAVSRERVDASTLSRVRRVRLDTNLL